MRIGMILDAAFPPDPRVENEALSLIAEGHQVFLFSLDFGRRSGEENHRGIHVVRYPAGMLLYKLSALAYTLPFYHHQTEKLIRDFIRRCQVEALHVHDMVIAPAAFRANRHFGLPVILDLHENRPEIMKHYRHVQQLAGRLLIRPGKWAGKYYNLAEKADRIVVVTEAAARDIMEKTHRNRGDIAVVPNTVRTEEFLRDPVDPGIAARMAGSFNIVYIGDTSLRRGTDTAIEAISLLKDQIPSIKLWIVGRSSADDELMRLTERLSVGSFVTFEGWQSPSLLSSYLRTAHVAVSPLKRNLHHDTTFANKLFQYMAAGVPVVASDCIAQAQVVRDENCGLIFQAGDSRELAERIRYLHDHADERESLGSSGRAAVLQRWNWDQTVRELLDIYRATIGSRT